MAAAPSTPASEFPELAQYWDAARAGRFLVRFCNGCGRAHWYPRLHCPFCFSSDTEFREGSGRGRIYSYTVVRKAAAPYVLAYVSLDEGPAMMTRIVECDPAKLRIGERVRLRFELDDNGVPLATFSPALEF